jgi:hypothetical protein
MISYCVALISTEDLVLTCSLQKATLGALFVHNRPEAKVCFADRCHRVRVRRDIRRLIDGINKFRELHFNVGIHTSTGVMTQTRSNTIALDYAS